MHPAKRGRVKTAQVTAHMTDAEKELIDLAARRRRVVISEYARLALLASVDAMPMERLILEELIELRFTTLQILTQGPNLSPAEIDKIVSSAKERSRGSAEKRIRRILYLEGVGEPVL